MSCLFLLDKPEGISSFAALGALKRSLNTRKVGHAGTLDPFATGLLVALSGKLTKAAYLISDMDKEYEAVFRFGKETDTLDTEGRITAEAPIPVYCDIQEAAKYFSGAIKQTPPAFSAVKINGKRAYSQARKGLDIEMPERTVRINNFELISWESPDLKVKIHCSKGTYIRSIARDLGIAAGSRAYCLSLRRTSIGSFSVNNAGIPGEVNKADGISPVEFAKIVGISIMELSDEIADRLRGGFPPGKLGDRLPLSDVLTLCTDTTGNPAALLEKRDNDITYRIVFDYSNADSLD